MKERDFAKFLPFFFRAGALPGGPKIAGLEGKYTTFLYVSNSRVPRERAGFCEILALFFRAGALPRGLKITG